MYLFVDVKYSKKHESGEDKELHYQRIKTFFKNEVKTKMGYYNTKNIDEIKQDINQREMWGLYTSCFEDIIQNNSKISSVIDVGCGMGHITLELINYVQLCNIVGIDFLRDTFNLARENQKMFRKISFIEGDLLYMPFSDRSFDLTICVNTLHHIHPKDFSQALKELARITDKYLILEIRYKYGIFNFWYQYLAVPNIYRNLPIYVNSFKEVNNLLTIFGFQLENICRKKQFIMACRRLTLVYKKI